MAHIPGPYQRSLEQSTSSPHSTPSSAPVALRPALSQLLRHYVHALTRPSVSTYTSVKEHASWSLVWIQLLSWAILDALLGVLVNALTGASTSSPFLRFFTLATSYGLLVVVPLLFFLLMGLVYLIAKAFGGQGTFLEQCHTSLTLQVPLGLLSKLLAFIPGIGRILNSVLSLYGIVLQVFVIMAVHRLSRGKAIASILIPLVATGALAGAIFLLTRK